MANFVKTWSKNFIKWQISPLDEDLISKVTKELVGISPIWYRLVLTSWKEKSFDPDSVAELINWLSSCIINPCFVKPRVTGIIHENSYNIGIQVWFSNKDDMTFFTLTWNTSINMYRTFDDVSLFEMSIRDSLNHKRV